MGADYDGGRENGGRHRRERLRIPAYFCALRLDVFNLASMSVCAWRHPVLSIALPYLYQWRQSLPWMNRLGD
jgi:hypothetical protein